MTEHILVVDDEAANRELLEAILERAGYKVSLAPDGPAALAQVASDPPDLLLLDLLMPGMHGQEVIRRLRDDPATASLPIIVVTAVGQVTVKEATLTGGADDFVTKPVRADDLIVRVRAMLGVRSIRAALDRTLAYLHELEAGRHARRRAVLEELGAGSLPPTSGDPGIPILLIDDEELTRQFYGDLLAEHGFWVFAASSGAEGLELIRRHRVEVVVLDIQMPGMSGLEVLGRLREEEPYLPVIMLTGHPTSQAAIASLKLGAFDFIVKGLDHSLVVLAVHRAVRFRRETLHQKEEVEGLRERLARLGGTPTGGEAGQS